MRKFLCALLAAALCVTGAVCASKAPLRRVYPDASEKASKTAYSVSIERDTETGVDYFILLDSKGNPVSMCRRDDAKGNPYVVSAITSQ